MKSGIKDCVKSYANKTGCSVSVADKVMRDAVDVLVDEIINNGGVSFIGKFSIEVVQREAKRGINPSTGMPHVIPARKTLKIVVGKQLKEELNK